MQTQIGVKPNPVFSPEASSCGLADLEVGKGNLLGINLKLLGKYLDGLADDTIRGYLDGFRLLQKGGNHAQLNLGGKGGGGCEGARNSPRGILVLILLLRCRGIITFF